MKEKKKKLQYNPSIRGEDITMTDNEMLQAIKQLLDPIRKNQEEMKLQIEGLQLQVMILSILVDTFFSRDITDYAASFKVS